MPWTFLIIYNGYCNNCNCLLLQVPAGPVSSIHVPPSCTLPSSSCTLPNQANIPTYEIITSCQPRVMYSNGYYFTTFSPTNNSYSSPSNSNSYPSPTNSTAYSPSTNNNSYSSPANYSTTAAYSTQPTATYNTYSSTQPTTYINPSTTYSQSSGVSAGPCYTCSCSCQGSLQWTISPNQATWYIIQWTFAKPNHVINTKPNHVKHCTVEHHQTKQHDTLYNEPFPNQTTWYNVQLSITKPNHVIP